MKDMPVEIAIEVERQIPEIVDVVQKRQDEPLVVVFDAFEGKSKLLYECVWYALSHGKNVLIERTRHD